MAFRHLPPSPPDTDPHDSPLIPSIADFDATGHYQNVAPERTRLIPRSRTSALSYQHSVGARDLRDRAGSYSRGPRNLVVVIPPPDFPLNHGQLGNVLSMGPRHRLSQGSLMPLFPSMFGQLNAIAREYNFPNTVGLCLYLHINENGITMTPRISEDSWQYLFGHLFESRAPSSTQQLPIGGSIEFDIDLNKARWFDAWVSGTLRDPDPIYPSLNSQTSLGAHWRVESQPRGVDEQPVEDRGDVSPRSHTLVTKSQPATLRHVPKKLSLVDRLESLGVHAPPKSQNHVDQPESPPTQETPGLSPIPQSAIPRVPKSDLEFRVNSWRETTELYSVSMTETYQPAPDVRVPVGSTTMDTYAMERNFQQAHDAYIWSPTSAGPRSPVLEPQFASPRPSSHLDHHISRSLPITPATATSWGPPDDEWHSVVSTVSRLPSPDTGERVVEDTLAPRRNAVWGNSFGWRSATTWIKIYPYSTSRASIRVQLQDGVSEYPNLVIYPAVTSAPNPSIHIMSPRRSVWGSSFGWQKAVTWQKVYPYSVVTLHSTATIQLRGAGGLVSGYPNLCIYPAVYPHLEIYPAVIVKEHIVRPVSVMLRKSNNFTARYPNLVIYPAVYPHFDIYPTVAKGMEIMASSPPDTHQNPLNNMLTTYPNLVTYPAVYPHFNLYPKALQVSRIVNQKEIVVKLANAGGLTAKYPNMTIYPSVYPYLDIYPTRETRTRTSSAVWGVSFGWLTAKTWIRVYPLHVANPLTRKGAVDARSISTPQSSSQSPTTTVDVMKKEAVWGSSFGWKDAATWRAVWPTSYPRIYPEVRTRSVRPQNGTSTNYPYLAIYPTAYPHFTIYPPPAADVMAKGSRVKEGKGQRSVNLVLHYPNLVIYAAVYPHFELYPASATDSVYVELGKSQSNLSTRNQVKPPPSVPVFVRKYPHLVIYSPVYPYFDLYPACANAITKVQVIRTAETLACVLPAYPYLVIYPPVYPYFDLYPACANAPSNVQATRTSGTLASTSQMKTLPSVSIRKYPHLVIYPPVYPYFILYPACADVPTLKNQATEKTESLVNLTRYPVFDIYPAVYPYFNIYPAIDLRRETRGKVVSTIRRQPVEVRLLSLYPNLNIYPAGYPFNLGSIYPSVNTIKSTQITVAVPRSYPWLVIYQPVYPFVIPYPGSEKITQRVNPKQAVFVSPPVLKSVSVKLPVCYPTFDLYPAGYPWSLESIYPAVSVDDYPVVAKPYPLVQLDPRTLDEVDHESTKASLAMSEDDSGSLVSAASPDFDLFPVPPTETPQRKQTKQDVYLDNLAIPAPQIHAVAPKKRKTHLELHNAVFRSLGKRPARITKTHQQLHNDVFQDGVVWTPSGYAQDLSSLTRKKPRVEIPMGISPRRPSQDSTPPRPPRSRPAVLAVQSPEKAVFPLMQPPALPPTSPLRVRSPGIPSQPAPAVSESPMPRVSSPTNAFTHKRTTSSRLTQAVKSMIPGLPRRGSSASRPTTPPPPEEHKQPAKDQTPIKLPSLVERRPTVVPPLPHTNVPELLARVPQRKESLVLQRARAYEQSTVANQSSSAVGDQGAYTSFTLPPLPSIPPMTDMVETFEKSKLTFP